MNRNDFEDLLSDFPMSKKMTFEKVKTEEKKKSSEMNVTVLIIYKKKEKKIMSRYTDNDRIWLFLILNNDRFGKRVSHSFVAKHRNQRVNQWLIQFQR